MNWWNPVEVGSTLGHQLGSAVNQFNGNLSNFGSAIGSMTNSAVEKQNQFNSEQAQLQRDWEERMANSSYQRAVQDLEAAGLNKWLAVQGAGMGGAATPSGAAASSNSASAELYGKGLGLRYLSNIFTSAMQAYGQLSSSVIKMIGGILAS